MPTDAVRAMRVSLNRLPSHVDRNNAREVLEFVTCSSYPTARDPLLAVAHAAGQIILAMHDELHAIADVRREDAKRIAELESVLREISSGKAPCDMGDVVLTAARLSGLARRALANGETTSVPSPRR